MATMVPSYETMLLRSGRVRDDGTFDCTGLNGCGAVATFAQLSTPAFTNYSVRVGATAEEQSKVVTWPAIVDRIRRDIPVPIDITVILMELLARL